MFFVIFGLVEVSVNNFVEVVMDNNTSSVSVMVNAILKKSGGRPNNSFLVMTKSATARVGYEFGEQGGAMFGVVEFVDGQIRSVRFCDAGFEQSEIRNQIRRLATEKLAIFISDENIPDTGRISVSKKDLGYV